MAGYVQALLDLVSRVQEGRKGRLDNQDALEDPGWTRSPEAGTRLRGGLPPAALRMHEWYLAALDAAGVDRPTGLPISAGGHREGQEVAVDRLGRRAVLVVAHQEVADDLARPRDSLNRRRTDPASDCQPASG